MNTDLRYERWFLPFSVPFVVGDAHGWRGRWLVNGSSKDIVELTIDPPVRAYVMGAPIDLRTLYVSVTDPQALIAACAPT
jgi:hypothetical protein